MGLPYHTHDFEVPEASADEVAQRLQVSKFVTPDKLDALFSMPIDLGAGTAAAPSLTGPQTDTGLHFPTDKVGIAADGVNVFRVGKDDTTVTNDTLLVVARTTAHGAPYFYLRNIDTDTPDGAGPFFGFQSYNDAGVLRDAIQTNGGLQDATAGAEGSSYDIAGYRAGTSEVQLSVNGAEAMIGPAVDNVYDLARASYRFKNGYFAGPVQLGIYAKASLPSASVAGKIIYVSDDTGGAVLAFSDGTNWRRVTDRNVIS